MANDSTYNGWTNYETWAVKLWMDNDEGSYHYWQDAAQTAYNDAGDKYPNQFMDRARNAVSLLAAQLKDEHDSDSDHPVFAAADGSVYADLLNAALSEVNWHEIAESLLDDVDKTEEEDQSETADDAI